MKKDSCYCSEGSMANQESQEQVSALFQVFSSVLAHLVKQPEHSLNCWLSCDIFSVEHHNSIACNPKLPTHPKHFIHASQSHR